MQFVKTILFFSVFFDKNKIFAKSFLTSKAKIFVQNIQNFSFKKVTSKNVFIFSNNSCFSQQKIKF